MHQLKRVCFYAALLFFVGTAVWTGMRIHQVASHYWTKPALICDEPVFDFGVIETDQELIHGFTLRIEGKQPITILGVSPGCGSQIEVVEFPKVPIPYGSEAKIILKLPTAVLTGQKSQTAVVKTDDSSTPVFVLTLKVNVQRLPDNSPPPQLAPIVKP